jgi:hypothetical protein
MISHLTGIIKMIAILALSRVMTNGASSLGERAWLWTVLSIVIGFSLWKYVHQYINTEFAGKYKALVDEWIRNITIMLCVALIVDGHLSFDWYKNTMGLLIGLSIYHLMTKKFINGVEIVSHPVAVSTIDESAKICTHSLVSALVANDSLPLVRGVATSVSNGLCSLFI